MLDPGHTKTEGNKTKFSTRYPPSGAAFEHCNHGYAMLQHCHIDRTVTVLLSVDSAKHK